MKIFKLTYILLILLCSGCLFYFQLREFADWVSDLGLQAFRYRMHEIVGWLVLLGAIGGLLIRKRAGWALMLFFLYFNVIVSIDAYSKFFGSDLRFLPIIFTVLLVLVVALIFVNSDDLKKVYQVQTGTKEVKLNLIVFLGALILAFLTSLLNLL